MKNLRMTLSIAAFLFAFAGAFATIGNVTAPEFIGPLMSGSTPCEQITKTCGTAGNYICFAKKAGAHYRVFDDKVGTNCVNLLTRNTNDIIIIP